MASVGLVMIGRGQAEIDGEVLDGAEAMRRAGIEPLRLEPKDGLTILSSNGVSIADGAIAVARASAVAERADVVAALSIEAIHGNPSIAQPVVGDAKPFPGQVASCAAIREALEGSPLLGLEAARSVQDPLSFRVIPQVHGALREAIAAARHAVEIELNGSGDNPLVSIEDDTMVHNGNFHPIVMAIAFDQLRIAIAHVGQISERRMSHHWDAFFERIAGPGEPTTGWHPPELFGLRLRYPAAAAVAELTQLSAPVTLDVPVLDMGIEDHATGAPLAVSKAMDALDLLEEILSIEVLMANDLHGTEPVARPLGEGTSSLAGRIREAVESLGADRSSAEVQRAVAAAMFPPSR
jgi:histidine ammonia-lyase